MSLLPLTTDKYSLEKLSKGFQNAEVTFRHKDGKLSTRVEILDVREEGPAVRYTHEPLAMIAFKCLNLFITGVPLFMACYTGFHLLRLPFVMIANLSPKAFCKQIWAIVRIPFYFIALEFSALYGVIRPLHGRALFGYYESALHDGKSRRESLQYEKKEVNISELMCSSLTELDHKESFFIAFCMQPVGKVDDPHITHVKILPDPAPNAALDVALQGA